jgi:non-specific serine/threonine protein kinase
VPTLNVPDPKRLPRLDKLSRNEAVALFVQRARSVNRDFQLTRENATAVAEICVRLDGLPLAIELAVARIRMLPPQAMLERLEPRLHLLATGARDLPERHRTLRSAIAWSYELLDEGEERLFRRLSVFVGGCTLEAAEAVCNPSGDPAASVLDGLMSLIDKSLVRIEAVPEAPDHAKLEQRAGPRYSDKPRYGMLDTIREFALAKLDESDEGDDLKRLHAYYYLSQLERWETVFREAGVQAWLERMECEYDNISAALTWALDKGELDRAFSSGEALLRYWLEWGQASDGRRWLEGVLAYSSSGAEGLRAKALFWAGLLAYRQNDLGRARELCQESANLYLEIGDKRQASRALNTLGNVAIAGGDYERARGLYEESLGLSRELGLKAHSAKTLNNLGELARLQGDYERASTIFEESLALFREENVQSAIPTLLLNLGMIARLQNKYDRAIEFYEESLTLSKVRNDKEAMASCFVGIAAIIVSRDQPDTTRRASALHAATLLGVAEDMVASIGSGWEPIMYAEFDKAMAATRKQLGEAAFEVARAEGREMTLEQAIAYAHSLPSSGRPGITHVPPARQAIPDRYGGLTARERGVATLIAQGKSNREIADTLLLGERTIESHVGNILAKLGFTSRAQIAAWVAEKGLAD